MAPDDPPADAPSGSVREAAARLDGGSGALLVDVREIGEFQALRALGAVLLPLSRFGMRFRELPADRPLLLFCRSGNRSAMATGLLRQQGYTDVSNVTGGIIAWRAAGLPVSSGPLGPGERELPSFPERST